MQCGMRTLQPRWPWTVLLIEHSVSAVPHIASFRETCIQPFSINTPIGWHPSMDIRTHHRLAWESSTLIPWPFLNHTISVNRIGAVLLLSYWTMAGLWVGMIGICSTMTQGDAMRWCWGGADAVKRISTSRTHGRSHGICCSRNFWTGRGSGSTSTALERVKLFDTSMIHRKLAVIRSLLDWCVWHSVPSVLLEQGIGSRQSTYWLQRVVGTCSYCTSSLLGLHFVLEGFVQLLGSLIAFRLLFVEVRHLLCPFLSILLLSLEIWRPSALDEEHGWYGLPSICFCSSAISVLASSMTFRAFLWREEYLAVISL